MLIYAVDDEEAALDELCGAIRTAIPSASLNCYNSAFDALKSLENEKIPPALVFLDICMPGMDGLSLAEKIKGMYPRTKIIFVTAFSQYALEAYRVHVSGYLMKPVSPELILDELRFLNIRDDAGTERLVVKCFGSFEAYYHGEPLIFGRKQTKEVLAYLIDREGRLCTAEELACALWEEEQDMSKAKHRLRNLVSDLFTTLKGIGQEHILIRKSGLLAVRKEAVECDYYRLLEGDTDAVRLFYGVYMDQYHWARSTEARLAFK